MDLIRDSFIISEESRQPANKDASLLPRRS